MAHGYLTLPPDPPPSSQLPSLNPIFVLPSPTLRPLPLSLWQPLLVHVAAVLFVPTVPKIKSAFLPADVRSRRRRQPPAVPPPQTHSPLHPWALCAGVSSLSILSLHSLRDPCPPPSVPRCLTYPPSPLLTIHTQGFFLPPPPFFFPFSPYCAQTPSFPGSSRSDPPFPIFPVTLREK